MDGYVLDAVLRQTKYFVAIHCILYLEIVVLLCNAIYGIRKKQRFTICSLIQVACDLCVSTIAWIVYALHVILVDGLGTWSENVIAIQDRIGISTIVLSVLTLISLALKLALLKKKKKQLEGGISSD